MEENLHEQFNKLAYGIVVICKFFLQILLQLLDLPKILHNI